MPNTRRRRFSVQNDIGGRSSSKMQNGLQNSHHNEDSKAMKSKNGIFASNSKTPTNLEIVAECESSTSAVRSKNTVDASSSNNDMNYLNVDDSIERCSESISATDSPPKNREARPTNVDKFRREKYPRQHCIKVRSPRRKPPVIEQKSNDSRRSVCTGPVDWEQEMEVCVERVTDLTETERSEEQNRVSSHSLDDMCRICHGGDSLTGELGPLLSACSCRGTVGRVHVKCLERWLTESGKSRCELCGTRYATKRVHRYGVPRALLMWVLSQNAKQLMVDSLGIMLMSPLAILAAWLSGRTLAGLMTQDSPATPWPLASTFVLACMTLVCYYCWIVSAATRHALGWWIWYRSQYEVRLELQESEE